MKQSYKIPDSPPCAHGVAAHCISVLLMFQMVVNLITNNSTGSLLIILIDAVASTHETHIVFVSESALCLPLRIK